VSTPNGGANWSHKAIRDCLQDDSYKPHTFEEISELVTPEVAARLNKSRCYGVWWYNRRKTRTRQVSERDPGGTTYRKQTSATEKPKKDWIAIPVPGSGVSREWVEAARDAIKDNQITSSAAQRTWTLSGGLFVCGVCGRSMTAMTTSRPNGKRYFYYRCPKRAQDGAAACSQAKYHVAEEVESGVWDLVRSVLTDPEQLRDDLERLIEQEQQSMRGDPEREVRTWLEKLSQVDRKRSGYIDLAADGILSRDELEAKLARLEESRETAEKELEALRTRQEKIQDLQRDKDALLDHYAALAPGALDSLAPEERHRLYGMLRLKIVARLDEAIELSGDLVSAAEVSNVETTYPHLVPIERQVISERRGRVYRLRVAPHGVFRDPVADPYRPVRGFALERTMRREIRGLEEVHPHIRSGEVVDRQVSLLVNELYPPAVSHDLAAEHHPHPAWRVLEKQHVVSGRPHLEIERLVALVAERSRPDRKSHRTFPLFRPQLDMSSWQALIFQSPYSTCAQWVG
jgi:Recombinase zinc beta ribbon domain